MVLAEFSLVFVAALLTAIGTGLGTLPFLLIDDVNDRWNVALWGFASGILLSSSAFGLVDEGLANGGPALLAAGLVIGVVLLVPLTFV